MRIPDEVRRDIVEVCRRLDARRLVAGTDGNVSVRLSKDRLVATPTGMSKGDVRAEDLVVCDLDGTQLHGRRRLTTEIKIHLAAYRVRDDVCAVVHAHPPYATAFAVAGTTPSEKLMPEAYLAVGPVALAPYGTPSTDELAAKIRPAVEKHDAVLLANHGAMTLGRDVVAACHRMEALEQLCTIAFLTQQLGSAQQLTREQIAALESIRGVYGSAPPNVPCYQCGWSPDEADDAAAARRPSAYVEPHVHWPGNPPVWERPGQRFDPDETRVRDLARHALRELRGK